MPSPSAPKEKAPPGRCRDCGRWSSSPEFGMDTRTGYCQYWEKLTTADFGCDKFVTKAAYDAAQARMMEELEEDEYEE
ncbi:MAG: hypothetical protein ACT4PT_05755 [Methanobacteriota archaeon]